MGNDLPPSSPLSSPDTGSPCPQGPVHLRAERSQTPTPAGRDQHAICNAQLSTERSSSPDIPLSVVFHLHQPHKFIEDSTAQAVVSDDDAVHPLHPPKRRRAVGRVLDSDGAETPVMDSDDVPLFAAHKRPRVRSLSPVRDSIQSEVASMSTIHAECASAPSDSELLDRTPIRTKSERQAFAHKRAWQTRRAKSERKKVAEQESFHNRLINDHQTQEECFASVLETLEAAGYTLVELLQYVSESKNKKGSSRYQSLFRPPTSIQRVLDLWVSKDNSPSGREAVTGWAINFVANLVTREARDITSSKLLQQSSAGVTADFVLSYHPLTAYDELCENACVMMRMLESFSTSGSSISSLSALAQTRKRKVQHLPSVSLYWSPFDLCYFR